MDDSRKWNKVACYSFFYNQKTIKGHKKLNKIMSHLKVRLSHYDRKQHPEKDNRMSLFV